MTIKDDINTLTAQVTQLTTLVQALPTTSTPPTVDFTPVLTAVAGVDKDVQAIAAQFVATPTA